jgi:hypothetical protein
MTAFARFALEIVSPPNPIRALDNSLESGPENGRIFYRGPISDFVRNCNDCHVLDATRGFFGTDGDMSIEGEPQEFKIAHLRNVYQKVGRFDVVGPQVRGFGFLHDGSVDTILTFLRSPIFLFPGFDQAQRDVVRRDVIAFLMRFPGELAPIVGQQVTLDSANAGAAGPRIDLLLARAREPFALVGEPAARECDLVVRSGARGWAYDPVADAFVPDASAQPPLADAALRALAQTPGEELTYTCAPPGSGTRIGIDRDRDGQRDADDNCPSLGGASQPDPDADGRGSGCDNCPGIANPDQLDRGGWGAASLADGRGDPCQCGDTTDDGSVTQTDIQLLREFLAGNGPLTSEAKCDLVGAPGSGSNCNLADSVAQRRRLGGEPLTPALDACGSAPN